MGESAALKNRDADIEVVRRLQDTLRAVREDEARLKQFIEIRRLKRRMKKYVQAK